MSGDYQDTYYAFVSDIVRKGEYHLENGIYKEPPLDLYFDVLINNELKRYKIEVPEGGYYSVGECVLFNAQKNSFSRWQEMPKEVSEAFDDAYIRKYEQIASAAGALDLDKIAKATGQRSKAKYNPHDILNDNELFLGISFKTGKVVLLLKNGDPHPDQLFGNNQSFIDLTGEEGYLSTNDAGVDMANCGDLFCVRPFSDFVNRTAKLTYSAAIILFNKIISIYLNQPEITKMLYEEVKSNKINIGRFYSYVDKNGLNEHFLKRLTATWNMERTIKEYKLSIPLENLEVAEENKL